MGSSQERNKELQDKSFIQERKIKKLEEQNKSAKKNIQKTDLDEIKEKLNLLKEKKETDYSIRRNR